MYSYIIFQISKANMAEKRWNQLKYIFVFFLYLKYWARPRIGLENWHDIILSDNVHGLKYLFHHLKSIFWHRNLSARPDIDGTLPSFGFEIGWHFVSYRLYSNQIETFDNVRVLYVSLLEGFCFHRSFSIFFPINYSQLIRFF